MDNTNMTNAYIYKNADRGLRITTGSNFGTFTNISLINNSHHGLDLQDSFNNTFDIITAINNSNYGINIDDGDNSTLTNIVSMYNENNGIYLYSSPDCTLVNITASYNRQSGSGIAFSSSYGSSVTNLESIDNAVYGISLIGNETINNATLWNNTQYGAGVWGSYVNLYNIDIRGSGVDDLFTEAWDFGALINVSISDSVGYAFVLDGKNNYLRNITITRSNSWSGISYRYLDSPNDGDESVTINGKPVKFYSNEYNPCPEDMEININETYAQVYFFDCDNITVWGGDLDGESFFYNVTNSRINNISTKYGYWGFVLEGSNNTLHNITSNENHVHGMYLTGYNNTFTDIVANHNTQIGIYSPTSSYNNTMINVNSSNNSQHGLYVQNFINSTLINATLSNNAQHGLYIDTGSNSTVINITANSNTQAGIYISGNIGYNNFSGVNLNFNQYGIQISGSDYNAINDSYITNNTVYGLYFQSGAEYNLFYNNYFNNSQNYYNSTTITNYFNTTNQTGPNIVNGTFIGGNYWENASTSTYDSTCADPDGDFFCNDSFSMDGDNNDSLPLFYNIQGVCSEAWSCSAWSTCSSAIQTRTCTDTNGCGTEISKPSESQSCSTGGGSGGGGIIADQETQTVVVAEIQADVPVEIEITNEEIEITTITIDVVDTVQDVEITVTEVDVLPQADVEIGLSSGETYQAFQITTVGVNDTNIEFATMDFKVDKAWLAAQGGIRNDIILFRKQESANQWDPLQTSFSSEDDTYYYFSAVTPGFSMFAIILDLSGCNNNQICETDQGENEINCPSDCKIIAPSVVCTPDIVRCFANQIQKCAENGTAWKVLETCPRGCQGEQCINASGFDEQMLILMIAIIIVIVLALYFFMSKTKSTGKEVSSRYRKPSGESA
jgi:PGF-pre-PGF domain-containing protein